MTLITGGAGFIGSNLACAVASRGGDVMVLDNFSRDSVERNARWLSSTFGDRVRVVRGDVRDAGLVASCVAEASFVFHFAAQVAVTTSLLDPVRDFEVNAGGTLNVLEALRKKRGPTPLIFTSTNKVYGELADIALACQGERYAPVDAAIRGSGVSESRRLDFHSPYGCSKGAADQYVIDYARTFGLPAVVFRMSCIYGQRQFGNEDQGWVAHFMFQALRDCPLTIYGDGRQVRDVLYVSDLVDALLRAADGIDRVSGRAFNIGGGVARSTSLNELVTALEALLGAEVRTETRDWRPGDQRYYVSDTRALEAALGWQPRVSLAVGLERLLAWANDASLRDDAPWAPADDRRISAIT